MTAVEGFLTDKDGKYVVTREDLKETMEYVSGYSLYSYEDEVRQGFLTVQGGHRVGVTGKVILDGNEIRGMKYISCINVRLAHEVVGCADQVMPYIRQKRLDSSYSDRFSAKRGQDYASSGYYPADQQWER